MQLNTINLMNDDNWETTHVSTFTNKQHFRVEKYVCTLQQLLNNLANFTFHKSKQTIIVSIEGGGLTLRWRRTSWSSSRLTSSGISQPFDLANASSITMFSYLSSTEAVTALQVSLHDGRCTWLSRPVSRCRFSPTPAASVLSRR